MPKYKHIFFDLDNTLYDFTSNSFKAMEDAFEKLQLTKQLPSFETFFSVYKGINDQLWSDYRQKKISKESLRGRRFQESLAHFGVKLDYDATKIDDLYLAIMPSKTILFPNTIEVLETLKKRAYKMHIITNGFKEVQSKKMKNTGLAPYFDKLFISEEIKSHKPSHETFEYAIKSANAKKSESIMIGDSWESDIEGAQSFGIDQVFFNIDKIELGGKKAPTFLINKLEELLPILQ